MDSKQGKRHCFGARMAMTLFLVALTATSWASTFKLTHTNNTFTISRSDKSTVETIYYRTVSLSAVAGVHFTPVYAQYTFGVGDSVKSVTIQETNPVNVAAAYRYLSGSYARYYRFEVLDQGGFLLTSIENTITYSYRDYNVPSNAFVSRAIDVIKATDSVKVTDSGYGQRAHVVSLSDYYTSAAPKDYLSTTGAELRMSVNLTAREDDDGYQHIQVIANSSSYDSSGKDKGDPGTPSISSYTASFSHYDAKVNSKYARYSFPVTTVGNCSTGVSKPWSSLGNSLGDLYRQYFKSGCRASDGKILLPSNLTALCIRFDASGSQHDDWYVRNVYANIQAVDLTAPTLNASGIIIGSGQYCKGNEVYITVPFSEIVNYSGTMPTLETTWDTLTYVSGRNTNALTFKGTISAAPGTKLTIHRITGSITDYKNNSLSSGDISKKFNDYTVAASYAYPIDYELEGGELASGYPTSYTHDAALTLVNPTRQDYYFTGWTGSNGDEPQINVTIPAGSTGAKRYVANWTLIRDTTETIGDYTFAKDAEDNLLIRTLADWNGLADVVAAGNTCEGKTFKMIADIGSDVEPVTKTIGRQTTKNKTDRKRFMGTFDGGNHTLTIALNTNDNWWQFNKGYCAPFAYVKNATIKNLHVAGSVTTSSTWASGLVGSTGDNGVGTVTIDKCQISIALTANYKAGKSTNYGNHGGLIGIAEGKATISDSWFDGQILGKEYKYSAGFIGINKGKGTKVTNCLFNPSKIEIENNSVEGSCEFVHSLNGGTDTITTAYWVMPFGMPENAQGQQVVTSYGLGDIVNEVTAADGNIYYIITGNSAWLALSEIIGGSESYYSLDQDYTAGNSNAALVIPAGKDFTLDMNGYSIDRGLAHGLAQANGYVIQVEQGATLTINGGTVKGGNNIGNGGGIYNEGTLNINGTTITDNQVELSGSTAVYGGGIYNTGTLNINGATITGNTGKKANSKGMGVYVADGGIITMGGDVQINNNDAVYYTPIVNRDPHDVYLDENAVITVVDALAANSSVGVEMKDGEGLFTSGLNGNGIRTNFFSDRSDYYVYMDEDGEDFLATIIDLSLADNSDNRTAIAHADGNPAHVTLAGRKFYKDGDWNTVCLPFDVDLNDAENPFFGAKVMTVDEVNTALSAEGELTLYFSSVTNTMQAGKPYIIKWAKAEGYDEADPATRDMYEPVFEDVTISSVMHDVCFEGGRFRGNYALQIFHAVTKSIVLLGVNSTLHYPGQNASIGAFRAYFDFTDQSNPSNAPLRQWVVRFVDDANTTTGVTNIASGEKAVKFFENGKLYIFRDGVVYDATGRMVK